MTLMAKEIMNKRIMAVTRQVSARDLAVLFLTGTLSGLPVIDQGGKLVGVLQVLADSWRVSSSLFHSVFISLA